MSVPRSVNPQNFQISLFSKPEAQESFLRHSSILEWKEWIKKSQGAVKLILTWEFVGYLLAIFVDFGNLLTWEFVDLI